MDLFVEFVGGAFIEDDGVVGLVLDCFQCKLPYNLLQSYYTANAGPLLRDWDLPLPFDHFFFCFLAPDDAAGA